MHRDCHVCHSEGFAAQARVLLHLNERSIIATLNVVDPPLLELGEAGLSNSAWRALGTAKGDRITVSHAPALGLNEPSTRQEPRKPTLRNPTTRCSSRWRSIARYVHGTCLIGRNGPARPLATLELVAINQGVMS